MSRPILISPFDDKVRESLSNDDMEHYTKARSSVLWATLDRGGNASVHMTVDSLEVSYSAKITSGELMVVKTVRDIADDDGFKCSDCGWSALWEFSNYADEVKFCPGCGAKVTTQ